VTRANTLSDDLWAKSVQRQITGKDTLVTAGGIQSNHCRLTAASARRAEELFIILEGEGTLRSPEGYQTTSKGDIIFFAEGPEGTHQLYNHSDGQLIYVDIRTKANEDVCEYPDSAKINILPAMDIFEETSKVSYYSGEKGVKNKWSKKWLQK